MIQIETVDLSAFGVTLPSDRVGMVLAQPYLSLTDAEPYQCTAQSRAQQLTALTETLNVARAARHGAPKTHFTIFPEYSIPGLDGVALVEAALAGAEWPTGTIVIGGTDALSRQEFATLAAEQGTLLNIHNGLDRVEKDEWINCGITWVKGTDGVVRRWLQPKLAPAWLEQNISCQSMFRGNSVFAFKGPLDDGTRYRFFSLICFDWIASVDNQKPWCWVIDDLRRQALQIEAELSVSWCFVIESNPRPSHDSFLTEVARFFDQTVSSNVRRDRACLVFANSAGKPTPGRTDLYGGTSVVFSKQALFAKPTCSPTFSNGGLRYRSSTLLNAYHDIFFRERGACIHSFSQVNPNSLNAGAAGKTIAVSRAFVFPLAGTANPRAPGAEVPACIKWLNDELDEFQSLSARYDTPLTNQVRAAHELTTAALRALPPQSVKGAVKLATQGSAAKHEDDWDDTESHAILDLVDSLDVLGVGSPPLTLGAAPPHATVVIGHNSVDVTVIRGASHVDCIEHFKKFLPILQHQSLLVSRDVDNTVWRQRFGSFLDPPTPDLGQDPKYTDPASGLLHLGFQNLLDVFRHAATAADIEGGLRAELAA